MTLGERVKKYRQMAGLSQEGLAEKLNVSRQAITKWESDSGIPDIDNLISLSKVMGISLDELVMGEKEKDSSDIKRGAITQRNKNSTLYLVSAICFLFACFCWLIYIILTISHGNDVAAVVGMINIVILSFPMSINLRRYIDAKEQGSNKD
ncbi:MAG: helix-turn-helix domain-containing protein [Lachnospiraceae bacterium]|nr:helix-turn-helix domain-containing protein [Lachnospiraceae bacterium]